MKRALLLSALLAGCSGGGIGERCTSNQDCDPGLACVAGQCVAFLPGTDATIGTDATTDRDAGSCSDAGSDADAATSTDAGSDASTCLNGHCYLVVPESVDWDTARVACEAIGMHLVTVADVAEGAFAYGLVGGGTAWIGLENDAVSCTFSWVTGEPLTYTEWGSAQPDQCAALACGFFWNSSAWGDGPCDTVVGAYVCEVP